MRRVLRKTPVAAVVCGVVLVAFLVVVYRWGPDALPALTQRLLGLGCAAMATVTYLCATRPRNLEDDLLAQIERGRHLDFGKELRKERKEHAKVELPLVGKITWRGIGGAAVFLVIAGWWLSPLAPVTVAPRPIDDLSTPLAQEITSLVLVCPDGRLAVALPPIRPVRTRRPAKRIPDDAEAFPRALGAIALGRYDRARRLLDVAAVEENVELIRLEEARALVEMYAGEPADALTWYQKALGREPDNTPLLCQAAAACIQSGDWPQAQSCLGRAIKLARAGAEKEPVGLAVCLHLQAALHQILGQKLDHVEEYNKEAQEIFAGQLGEDSPQEAASLNNQAVHVALRAGFPGARNLSNWAIEIWGKQGRKDPGLAVGLSNRAMCEYLQGQYVLARKSSDDALIRFRNSEESGSPVIALSMNGNALLALMLAQYEEARPAELKMLVTAFEKAFGARHPSVAAAMNTVGKSYQAKSLYAMAQIYHAQAADIIRQSLGAEHAYLASTLVELAETHLLQGHLDEAEKACHEATTIAEKSLGPEHPDTALCLKLQGRIRLAQGRPRDAQPLFEKALDIEHATLGETHPAVADTLGYLASMAADPQTVANGIAQYEEAIRIYETVLGDDYRDHPAIARLLVGLARLHVAVGRHAEAEPYLKRAMEIRNAKLVPFHPDLAETLEAEAEVLRRLDPPDPQRADSLAARAKAVRKKHAEENRREEKTTP